MPMLDAYISAGALSPVAERKLISELTDLLLRHEGADPSDPRARAIAWVFLHRPADVFVAGEPAAEPRYRFIASVPEGQFDDERRAAIVRDVTDAVLRAENGSHSYDPNRVWVFTNEVPDGTWGGAGRINTLADIVGYVTGDADQGRTYAERTFAARRASRASVPTSAR
jgi:phenylpyruvate tautomerase PptA (4-oxalocrotonate tautomerase family)